MSPIEACVPAAGAIAGRLGFEALLRWQHPRLGNVSPGVFIPIAEGNGLVETLGTWVLNTACAEAAAWVRKGYRPREVAVNVSAVQLNGRFVEDVARALHETALPSQLLCLELTESLYAGNHVGRVERTIRELKSLGVKLALDDFGTGYSSLSSLGSIPFDKLKLDRSFVQGVENCGKRRKLLEGVVRLGTALGHTVIAEGAETLAEVELLRNIGVGVVQGFAFSKPVLASEVQQKADEIEAWSRSVRISAG